MSQSLITDTHTTGTDRAGREWFRDLDGIKSIVQHPDEKRTFSVDWTHSLASSETISSVAYDASGVTVSGAALSSPTSTITVEGSGGSLKITATLSTGRKLVDVRRFYRDGPLARDYGR